MEAIKLKNGSQESKALVQVVMFSLEDLFTNKPIHAYELVSLCRDPSHKLFGNTREMLERLTLVRSDPADNAQYFVETSIRNIVLSAVEGEGLQMRLTHPF